MSKLISYHLVKYWINRKALITNRQTGSHPGCNKCTNGHKKKRVVFFWVQINYYKMIEKLLENVWIIASWAPPWRSIYPFAFSSTQPTTKKNIVLFTEGLYGEMGNVARKNIILILLRSSQNEPHTWSRWYAE